MMILIGKIRDRCNEMLLFRREVACDIVLFEHFRYHRISDLSIGAVPSVDGDRTTIEHVHLVRVLWVTGKQAVRSALRRTALNPTAGGDSRNNRTVSPGYEKTEGGPLSPGPDSWNSRGLQARIRNFDCP